jgi:hypothetical protein
MEPVSPVVSSRSVLPSRFRSAWAVTVAVPERPVALGMPLSRYFVLLWTRLGEARRSVEERSAAAAARQVVWVILSVL